MNNIRRNPFPLSKVCFLIAALSVYGCAAVPKKGVDLGDGSASQGLTYVVDKRPSKRLKSRTAQTRKSNVYLYGDDFFSEPPIVKLDAEVGKSLGNGLNPNSVHVTRFDIKRVESVLDRAAPGAAFVSPMLELLSDAVGVQTGGRYYSCSLTAQLNGRVFFATSQLTPNEKDPNEHLRMLIEDCINNAVAQIDEALRLWNRSQIPPETVSDS